MSRYQRERPQINWLQYYSNSLDLGLTGKEEKRHQKILKKSLKGTRSPCLTFSHNGFNESHLQFVAVCVTRETRYGAFRGHIRQLGPPFEPLIKFETVPLGRLLPHHFDVRGWISGLMSAIKTVVTHNRLRWKVYTAKRNET